MNHLNDAALPGVNLVGYASSPLGLGEDLRQAAVALLALGVRVNIIDLQTTTSCKGYDAFVPFFGTRFVYPVSIFFMSPFAYALFWKQNSDAFAHTYKVGNFLWELEDFPRSWLWVLREVDEIWVPTEFVASIYAKADLSSVCLVNPAPAVPPEPSERSFRAQLGYEEEVFVFGFMFDLHSTPQRKNPIALLKAYEKCRLLLMRHVETALLIKVHRADRPSAHLDEIKAYAAKLPGVRLYEETLPADQVVDFYNTLDAYVSLHRSEGLGRTLIEAVQLGLPTICTNYSGERDVLLLCEAQGIPYHLVPCSPRDYPNSEGSVWAEPSPEYAAVLMARTARDGRRRLPLPDRLNNYFSAENYAMRTMARLAVISSSL